MRCGSYKGVNLLGSETIKRIITLLILTMITVVNSGCATKKLWGRDKDLGICDIQSTKNEVFFCKDKWNYSISISYELFTDENIEKCIGNDTLFFPLYESGYIRVNENADYLNASLIKLLSNSTGSKSKLIGAEVRSNKYVHHVSSDEFGTNTSIKFKFHTETSNGISRSERTIFAEGTLTKDYSSNDCSSQCIEKIAPIIFKGKKGKYYKHSIVSRVLFLPFALVYDVVIYFPLYLLNEAGIYIGPPPP